MSTRTTLRPVVVMNAVSMATNQTSAVTILQSLSVINYSFSWSGTTPVGTISIQGSNDYSLLPTGTVQNAGTWNTLTLQYNGTLVTSVPVAGNTGTGAVDIETGFYALRAVYTAASGTGALTAYITGKVK